MYDDENAVPKMHRSVSMIKPPTDEASRNALPRRKSELIVKPILRNVRHTRRLAFLRTSRPARHTTQGIDPIDLIQTIIDRIPGNSLQEQPIDIRRLRRSNISDLSTLDRKRRVVRAKVEGGDVLV